MGFIFRTIIILVGLLMLPILLPLQLMLAPLVFLGRTTEEGCLFAEI